MSKISLRSVLSIAAVMLLGMAAGLFLGSARFPQQAFAKETPAKLRLADLTGDYHAVALTNGSVYIGQLTAQDTSMPVLRNVFYVHCEVDKDTKKVTNVLVKRGKEWHGPDKMYLNPEHILLIEPVSPTSRVADLVRAGNE